MVERNHDVRITGGPRRCAYCHDEVPEEERVACSACFAAHHRACWLEAGLCATCRAPRALTSEPASAPRSDDYLTFGAVRQDLGVTEEVLKWLVAKGHVRAYRDGQRMAFRAEEVRAVHADLPAILAHRGVRLSDLEMYRIGIIGLVSLVLAVLAALGIAILAGLGTTGSALVGVVGGIVGLGVGGLLAVRPHLKSRKTRGDASKETA